MGSKKGVPANRYDEDFKKGAIKLVIENGRNPKKVSEELGISADTIRNWLKQSGYSTTAHKEKAENDRLKQLETENKALKKQLEKKQEALDILKKSIGIITDI